MSEAELHRQILRRFICDSLGRNVIDVVDSGVLDILQDVLESCALRVILRTDVLHYSFPPLNTRQLYACVDWLLSVQICKGLDADAGS